MRKHPPGLRHYASAIDGLLKSKDPSIRYLTLGDILEEAPDSSVLNAVNTKTSDGLRVQNLLSGQRADGGFGSHPYQKWTGTHWRLVSLIELGLPEKDDRARVAANHVLRWLWSDSHRGSIKKIRGLTRRCASQEGNALAVCSRLGLAEDERVKGLADSLLAWQWPDGGWNCDERPEVSESSFYETLAPL